MTQTGPVMTFKSHIEGKNADVAVWPDRIEWGQNAGGGVGRTTARWTAAAATGGLSLLKTGLGGKSSTNMIPIRMIQGVTTQKAGLRFTVVRVATAADAIEFHVTKGDAENIKATITNLMLNGPTAPAPPVVIQQAPAATPQQAPAAGPPGSLADELRKLAELRDAGVLSPEEFDAQKAKLLS